MPSCGPREFPAEALQASAARCRSAWAARPPPGVDERYDDRALPAQQPWPGRGPGLAPGRPARPGPEPGPGPSWQPWPRPRPPARRWVWGMRTLIGARCARLGSDLHAGTGSHPQPHQLGSTGQAVAPTHQILSEPADGVAEHLWATASWRPPPWPSTRWPRPWPRRSWPRRSPGRPSVRPPRCSAAQHLSRLSSPATGPPARSLHSVADLGSQDDPGALETGGEWALESWPRPRSVACCWSSLEP